MKLTREQIEAIVQWDVGTWSRALVYWDGILSSRRDQRALELGGRSGGLSLWLALRGASVVCSDLENVESIAGPLHKRHGISEMIEYRDIDATDIPFTNQFDVVAFKSIIGGIGRHGDREKARKVFAEIHRALKPGGTLLFAENLAASPVHAFMRKRFVKWGGDWTYWKREDLAEFMSDFSKVELKTTGFSATFGRTEGQRHFLAGMDRYFFHHLFPDSWHYVAYGVAVK